MRQFVFLLIVWAMMVACSADSPSDVGTDFFNEGVLDYAFIDSSTVKLSTIKLEDLSTNGGTRLLLGSHADEKLGRLTMSNYFQVTPSSSSDVTLKYVDNISYEHLLLVLKYDKYYYYDTTQNITLRVHEVTQTMELDKNNQLFNDKTFTIDQNPLGTVTFQPLPHRIDSVVIKLSDALGQDLWNKATNDSEQLTNSTNFLRYLKGLAILPDTTTSTGIIGFTITPELRLYYYDKSVTPSKEKYIAFPASTSNIVYTNIHANRLGTKLTTLKKTDERLSASVTDEEAYIQAGAGLELRVDMPYLRDLKMNTNFYMTQAILDMYPIRKSYSDVEPLPSALSVYLADKKNNIYGQLSNKATLVLDKDLGRDTKYSLDVTAFVKSQMNLTEFNENALIFTIGTNYTVSADRVYMGNNGINYKTKLRIYFVTVNN
ncbi:DUF4270 family protein [Ohtaekwangia sp.]|uniref:DUF4270 family protein n=1 Tax=Ohtaekwangia sp. TaxID=2066019 RepID=UPI002F91F284